MKIQLIRNATMIISYGAQNIIVDPCLGPKGSLPPYIFFRRFPRFNPVVPLPENINQALEDITAGLITHCRMGHFDHLDKAGARLLSKHQVPVYCNALDEVYLKKRKLSTIPLYTDKRQKFLEGSITPCKTSHGYGLIGKIMGPGAGYFIELPGEPSLYISGDTVLTPIVRNVLSSLKPDISFLWAGTPVLDIGRPILMPMDEMLEFINLAPGIVIASHMEAFNHCTTTRADLKEAVHQAGLTDKVRIPEDGEVIMV